MPVRLFVGNLPFGATEADLRQHFSAVAPPTSILMPVNRETGKPRGFAFVDFPDRALAEEAIRRFNGQLFQGRPLAVSEARAREDRPPGPRFGDRPAPTRALDSAVLTPPPHDRPFGRPGAETKRAAKPRRPQKSDSGPRGPIRVRHTGRVFDVDTFDDEGADQPLDFEDFATSVPDPYRPAEDEEEQ